MFNLNIPEYHDNRIYGCSISALNDFSLTNISIDPFHHRHFSFSLFSPLKSQLCFLFSVSLLPLCRRAVTC